MTARKGLLARIAIDDEALLDFKEVNRTSINAHRTLTRVLEEFAVVDWRGDNDELAVHRSITQLSSDMGTLWTKVLDGLHDSNRLLWGERDETMHDILARGDLPSEVRAHLDLVVVSEQAAQQRGIPVEGYAQQPGEPEISVAESVTNCATIGRVQALRARGIYPTGTSRQVVWDEVFAVVAGFSTEATLLDGFFLAHVLETKTSPRDHAEWLVRKLDSSLIPGSSLRMFCFLPKGVESDEAERTLQELISPLIGGGNLSHVTVVLAPEGGGARLPHDRHLRFSCGVAVTSEEGFDRLGTEPIYGVDGFTWNPVLLPEMLGQLAKRESVYLRRSNKVEFQIRAVSAR